MKNVKKFIVVTVTDIDVNNKKKPETIMWTFSSKKEVINFICKQDEQTAIKNIFAINAKAEVWFYTVAFDERLYLVECDANKVPYLHDDTMPDEEFDTGGMF